jgi:hypothetical protein
MVFWSARRSCARPIPVWRWPSCSVETGGASQAGRHAGRRQPCGAPDTG